MIRYRRYRAFMAFTVIAIFALYQFSGYSNWHVASAIGAGSLKSIGTTQNEKPQAPLGDANAGEEQSGAGLTQPEEPKQQDKLDFLPPSPTKQAAPVSHTPALPAVESIEKTASSQASPSATQTVKVSHPHDVLYPNVHELDDMSETGEGRKEEVIPPPVVELPKIHWSKQPEHFPVETTIQLPTGTPKPIPRIQHKFATESSAESDARKEKLKIIRNAVTHAWNGYKAKAWMKDEVRPVTGGSRDPFCGWAATLVDALDTLWITGMMEEFEIAVSAVGEIDFTTSQRKDIPVFETTIRYLGGMLSAYDLSGAKHKVLLDKAVELAEVLMGAFDTPNRMPMTFYRWMPTFASQPHRAGTHVVLAEIGSLSMEFTRLAQLTKEPKYYDAIDRITDAFLEWQSASGANATLIPGLFPVHVDASGCEKPAQIKSHYSSTSMAGINGGVMVGDGKGVKAERPVAKEQSAQLGVGQEKDGSSQLSEDKSTAAESTSQIGAPAVGKGKIIGWDDPIHEGNLDNEGTKAGALGDASLNKGKIIGWGDPIQEGDLDSPKAKAAVLGEGGTGGLAKRQFGGLEDEKDEKDEKSKTTSDNEISQKEAAAKKKTLEKDVCVPRGLASSNAYGSDTFTIGGMADSLYEYFPKEYLLLGGLEDKYRVLYEQSMDAVTEHLLFRPMIPQDSDILFAGEFGARTPKDDGKINGKLKPEGAHLTCFAGGMYAMGAKIFGRKEDLDLGARLTEGCVWAYNVTNTGIMPEHFLLSKCESMDDCAWNKTKYWEELDPNWESRTRGNPVSVPSSLADSHAKRQLDTEVLPTASKTVSKAEPAVPNSVPEIDFDSLHDEYVPPKRPSHEEFVLARIDEERLPVGMTRITSRKYILRPEAIESVFYMYRITGDEHWREVGWQMFEAVHKHTFAQFGASAIDDVTKSVPEADDSEESFWLAETLKYFFLLFSDPDLISLDEWVLNTEAHPFRRPMA